MLQAPERLVFYASVGSRLDAYQIDTKECRLAQLGSRHLPASVQYVVRHPALPFLYVASSDQFAPDSRGIHEISVFQIDRETGDLKDTRQGVGLRARPIHITIAATGDFAFVAYNNPSGVTVHAIDDKGRIGSAISQENELDTGTYAHQVRVMPSGREVLLVTRGNPPKDGMPGDRGALKLYGFERGQLVDLQSVSPGPEGGFGPRHVDFHPTSPWTYVSVETQNQLQAYLLENGRISQRPFSVTTTLQKPIAALPSQMAGAIHVHPNGRFVYVANRSDATRHQNGQPVYAGGENTIAVFSIDPKNGLPTLIQSIDTRGIHARTFSLDGRGRMLVVANTVSLWQELDGSLSRIPAGFSIYRLADDGTMSFVRKYDVELPGGGWGDSLFWSGITELH